MRQLYFLFLCVLLFSCNEPTAIKLDSNKVKEQSNESAVVEFDSTLAKKLGGDASGLKKYTFCFLDKGITKVLSLEEHERLEVGHVEYIEELIENKEIVLAGYFNETKIHLGLLVFASNDPSYVNELLSKDPKVKEGLLVPVLQSWTSSAAIHELYDIHQKIDRKAL